MNFPAKLGRWWSGLQTRHHNERLSIGFTDACIEQTGSQHSMQLGWQQITDVYAFKKECVTVDQIRILLGDEPQRKWIEVTEDDEGYREFIAELPKRLPGCLSEESWWGRVAKPPFETQWTALYKRVDTRPS